jgi:hypothetical protein
LESKRFPDAVFSPDRVKGRPAPSGESQVEVHGSILIHGGEHEMTIPVSVNVQTDLVMAKAKFAVPYVAWGMKDPSNFVLRVDKTVDVEVVLTGTVAAHSQAWPLGSNGTMDAVKVHRPQNWHYAATILTSSTATLFVLFAAATGTELVSTRFGCLQPDCLPA